jgi:Protein of unknown function (DUF3455)
MCRRYRSQYYQAYLDKKDITMKQYYPSASLMIMLLTLGSSPCVGSIPLKIKNAQIDPTPLPQVPDALKVPSNQRLILKAAAKGSQIYTCSAKIKSETAYEWTLKAPSADLFNDQGQRLGKHYAGPTWEIQEDRSKVVGVLSAKVNGPQTDTIPWLLLSAKSHQGHGILSPVNWIQRLDTAGGKAPARSCDKAHQTTEVRVPYTANYYFYGSESP